MFSWSYFWKASVLFLRYPSAIPKLFRGTKTAAEHINKVREQKWAQSQITRRNVYGFTIELNKNDIQGISPSIGLDGIWELEQTELLKKILKKDMTFVDVGANIGWYTLLSARIVGNKGQVLAYEPEPDNFCLLQRSIEENGFRNVKAFRKCVSNSTEQRTLWKTSDNLGGHSIIRRIEGNSGILVDSTSIDTSLRQLSIQKVNVLKIDAEGAEPEIVEGARESLQEARISFILLEWNPEVWLKHKDLLEWLLERFEVYQYVRSPCLIKRVSKDMLYSLPTTGLYLRYLHMELPKVRQPIFSRDEGST